MKKIIISALLAGLLFAGISPVFAQDPYMGAYDHFGNFHYRGWWCENYPDWANRYHPEFECEAPEAPPEEVAPPPVIYGHYDRWHHWHSERFYQQNPGWR